MRRAQERTTVGPLVSAGQRGTENGERVERYITRGKASRQESQLTFFTFR